CAAPTPVVIEKVVTATPEPTPELEVTNVAFVLLWECADNGWTAAHCRGIQEVRELGQVVAETGNSFDVLVDGGRQVHVVWVERAEDGPDSGRIIRDFASNGYDLIFATTFGQMDYALEIAAEFPQVAIEHCSGYKTRENMSWYFARMYQGEHVLGYAAGLMGYHQVGAVATNPIPEPIRGINAFTLGLQKGLREGGHGDWAEADDLVTVVWLNSWRDAEGEVLVAQQFADDGYDLVRQMADTPDSSKAACSAGIAAVGYGMNAADFGATCALGSSTWLWGSYYKAQVLSVLDGTWEGGQTYWGGLGNVPQPMIGLEGWNVPPDILAKAKGLAAEIAERERQAVAAGKDVASSDGIFIGPIYNQVGDLVVAEGEALSDEYLLAEIRWFVFGVKGKIQ
ncbi:BMP family ABC transporter substrate-binding protein, partial [Candidatus Parcubacteria bacterium]|nr:BMP family ABC transporter substrate-binding protein [Candidatus Parcubacteria bacterium]